MRGGVKAIEGAKESKQEAIARDQPYLGSYNGIYTFVAEEFHVSRKAVVDTDALELLVFQDPAHVGVRLDGGDLVEPLTFGGQELGEFTGTRRQIDNCGFRVVGEPRTIEQDVDAAGGEGWSVFVVQGGVAEAALRRGVESARGGGRHGDY